MASRRVFTLDNFLFLGSVGTCLLRRMNPSLTILTLRLSLALRLATADGSLSLAGSRDCAVRFRPFEVAVVPLLLFALWELLLDFEVGAGVSFAGIAVVR